MKHLIAALSILFVVACGDTNYYTYNQIADAGTPTSTTNTTISVEVPKDLLTDTKATVIVTWTGDIQEGTIQVLSSDGTDFGAQMFSLAGMVYTKHLTFLFDVRQPNTGYLVTVTATDKEKNSYEALTTFESKPAPAAIVSLSYTNVTSVGAIAVIDIMGTKQEGACIIYRRYSNSNQYSSSMPCKPGKNYLWVYNWERGSGSTYFVAFQSGTQSVISDDAVLIAADNYELGLTLESQDANGFALQWQVQKQYGYVEVYCNTNDYERSWSARMNTPTQQTGAVQFNITAPGSYSCRAYGNSYLPAYGQWVSEVSAALIVIVAQPPIYPYVTITADSPAPGSSVTQAVTTGTAIGRFKIVNNGNSRVTLEHLKFNDLGSHLGLGTKYRLHFSSQNSTDYTSGMMAGSSSSTDFQPALDVVIDGGSYRYFTVVIDQIGVAMSGDWWQLEVSRDGDVTFKVAEVDLGFDANGNGVLTDTIGGQATVGNPRAGALIKQ